MKRRVETPLLVSVLVIGLSIVVTGQTFTTLHNFTGSNDGNDVMAALLLSSNTLYGTAAGGGSGGNGTVFKLGTDGTAFTTLHAFTGNDGVGPRSALVLSGNTLYGTAGGGGRFGNGAVFAINTDGTGFTNLHDFTASTDGSGPFGLILSSNTLYGTTQSGGGSGGGTVFAIKTDGTDFTNLHSFSVTNSDGAGPAADLFLSGNTLYGTTQWGGSWGNGTVFAISTDGTGFTNLHSFTASFTGLGPFGGISTNSDGVWPNSTLVLSGTTLFGTAKEGGGWDSGTVFAVHTDGTSFRTLWSFSQLYDGLLINGDLINWEGGHPNGLALSGDALYGTTEIGSQGNGTVFAVDTNGTGLSLLYSFSIVPYLTPPAYLPPTNYDGSNPYAGLIVSSNTLYGTTTYGGAFGLGTVFSLSSPLPQDWEPGFATATNNGTITITQYLGPGDAGVIPGTINGFPVAIIGTNAFSGCTTLTDVTIPGSVTSIGDNAFDGCVQLANVTIGNSGTNIGDMAIGASAFQSCSEITNLTIGNSVASIGNSAFAYCNSLRNVAIPNSVTNIGDKAFAFCRNLTSVTIGDHVINIGSYAFGNSPLPSVTIPNSVTSIGTYAFYDCPLTNIVIPNSVTNIGDSAFEACQFLVSVMFGNSVTTIGNQAFEWCTNLTSLTIPGSVTNIGNDAFGYCFSLTGIYFSGNAPNAPVASWTVFDYDSNAAVYYLPGTTGWGPTFGGVQTMLWKPQVQTSNAGFGVRTNQFGFTVNWASGMTVVVEASTNLDSPIWSPLATNIITGGLSYFSDSQWTNYPNRFYRVRSP
jgi:uncharacterized repeat protein (TIGR03803 family)